MILLIRFYQTFLSPLCPGVCRFLKTHGIIKGSYLGIRRILRCHPWGGSGYDPVPPKATKEPDKRR